MDSITRRKLLGSASAAAGVAGALSSNMLAQTPAPAQTITPSTVTPAPTVPRAQAAVIDVPPTTSTIADRDRREQWWHQARFGMFIHFGLYSVLGRHEWAMEEEGIPVAEYQELAKQFNPRPHAAREWAELAKRAGMKYMVMTTKHHEGFCKLRHEAYRLLCSKTGGRTRSGCRIL